MKTICPNHEGAYDCTPFCNLCEGQQEYDPDNCTEPAPESVYFTTAQLSGAPVAKCNACQFTSVYWECGHDLEHECEETN